MSIQPVEWDGVKTLENELLLSLERKVKSERHSARMDCRYPPVHCFPNVATDCLGLNPDSASFKLYDFGQVINLSVPQLRICKTRIKMYIVRII